MMDGFQKISEETERWQALKRIVWLTQYGMQCEAAEARLLALSLIRQEAMIGLYGFESRVNESVASPSSSPPSESPSSSGTGISGNPASAPNPPSPPKP